MEWQPALNSYKEIKYSHIKIHIDDEYALTSDPWSHIHNYILKLKNNRKSKSAAVKSVFYLNLAQNFYKAADVAELPAKATLLYYGMLNLVKVLLSLNGVELEKSIEHHGLTIPLQDEPSIKILKPKLNDKDGDISIFAEFVKILGGEIKNPDQISLEQSIVNIPELHSAYKFNKSNKNHRYLNIDIGFETDVNNKKIRTFISYNKKMEFFINRKKIYKGRLKEYFRIESDSKKVFLYSKKIRKPVIRNMNTTYKNILSEYDDFNICTILTNSGYNYYIDINQDKYHHLCYTFVLMFYLGSAARYRPTAMNDVLSGDLRQIVSEAFVICPRQFLYQLSSHITGTLCLIPHAKI